MCATSIGDFFFDSSHTGGRLLFFASKILATLNDDGEIKRDANAGIASWITGWLK